jgi:hypothetical protein
VLDDAQPPQPARRSVTTRERLEHVDASMNVSSRCGAQSVHAVGVRARVGRADDAEVAAPSFVTM